MHPDESVRRLDVSSGNVPKDVWSHVGGPMHNLPCRRVGGISLFLLQSRTNRRSVDVC